MSTPYRRRRPALLRNLWAFRYLIAVGLVLGILGWFCWSNGGTVTVRLPFGLGPVEKSLGVVILLSALVGAVTGVLAMGLFLALRRLGSHRAVADEEDAGDSVPDRDPVDDRPPPNYASKTGEGFADAPWSREP
ncbi:MAG: LapA family protein [Isosphaeraceae bacterium]